MFLRRRLAITSAISVFAVAPAVLVGFQTRALAQSGGGSPPAGLPSGPSPSTTLPANGQPIQTPTSGEPASPNDLFGYCQGGHYCFWRDANWGAGVANWYGQSPDFYGYYYSYCSSSCIEYRSMSSHYNHNTYDAVDDFDQPNSVGYMFCTSVGYGTSWVGQQWNDQLASTQFLAQATC